MHVLFIPIQGMIHLDINIAVTINTRTCAINYSHAHAGSSIDYYLLQRKHTNMQVNIQQSDINVMSAKPEWALVRWNIPRLQWSPRLASPLRLCLG